MTGITNSGSASNSGFMKGGDIRFACIGNEFLKKKDPFAYSNNKIILTGGTSIDVYNGTNWRNFYAKEDLTIDPATMLDTGTELEFGKDYYVYLCTSSTTPEICISTNASAPSGHTALNSHKIGFFHYGTVRKVNENWIPVDSNGVAFGSTGTKWQDNVTEGVVPNSIGDLLNKPKNFMPGMVKCNNTWVSIYQMSVDEGITFMDSVNGLHIASGKLKSAYGALPATGTEGLNCFNFNELASRQGMRLPSYMECCQFAFGAPQGLDGADTYGWTKTTNTARTYTGCNVNTASGAHVSSGGTKPYAISAYNVVDTTGNVWEWCNDTGSYYESTSFTWRNVLGANMGQAFLSGNTALKTLLFGGYWSSGVNAGARAVLGNSFPWYVDVGIGARFACDSAI